MLYKEIRFLVQFMASDDNFIVKKCRSVIKYS